eukprot:57245-Chlamydomonas_euryale.AAC.1
MDATSWAHMLPRWVAAQGQARASARGRTCCAGGRFSAVGDQARHCQGLGSQAKRLPQLRDLFAAGQVLCSGRRAGGCATTGVGGAHAGWA